MRRLRVTAGIEVIEVAGGGIEVTGIVDCVVEVSTTWQCPACRHSFRKPGAWSGTLRTCRCGARYFLRREAAVDTARRVEC